MSGYKTVKITGLSELEKMLGEDFLVQPELVPAMESFQKRLLRGGKGLGAKRNEIAFSVVGDVVRARTTRRHPRQSGGSWQRKNQRIIAAMAPRVFAKMVRNIEARWAAEGRSVPAGTYDEVT